MTRKGHPGRSSLSKLHLIFDLDCCTLATATKIRLNARLQSTRFAQFCQTVLWLLRPEEGRMAKRKHRMVPRRPAVLLALLASASNQTLLAALTVGSLNTALVSSASAATCVTSVSPTFANVVGDVTGGGGPDCGDGRNADDVSRFDECDGQSRGSAVFNQCDSQSGHRNRSNQCDSDHWKRNSQWVSDHWNSHWHHPHPRRADQPHCPRICPQLPDAQR